MKTWTVKPEPMPGAGIRCTPIDAQLRRLVPRCGYYFHARLDPARLVRALSVVLSDYHAFAGRASSRSGTDLQIVPSEEGVPLEVVDSPLALRQLVDAENRSGRGRVLTPGITARGAVSGKGPLFAVRITQAADGSALGFAWHHPVGDYGSVHWLMRAWGQAYRGLSHDKGFEVEDRDAYFREQFEDSPGARSGMRVMPLGALLRLAPALYPPHRRVMFELSEQDLLSLRPGLEDAPRATLEDAMWAQIFVTILRLRGVREATLAWIVNMRKRLAIPANYIGNATAPLSQAAAIQDGAARIAAEMRARMKQYESRHVNYHATRRFIDEHAGWWESQRLAAVELDPSRPAFVASSLVGFKHEEVVFEPDAPAAGFYVTPADGGFWNGVSFEPPTRPAGQTSRVVSIWLPPKLAQAFEGGGGRELVLSAGLSMAAHAS